ncbi:hypothetical protein AAFN60_03215 [Roseibacillus persicicus]|uniref:hypothetical protein n=1 Tax=Roseibacillus persicicus TaxID=454148 RepID=UPI00398A9CF3
MKKIITLLILLVILVIPIFFKISGQQLGSPTPQSSSISAHQSSATASQRMKTYKSMKSTTTLSLWDSSLPEVDLQRAPSPQPQPAADPSFHSLDSHSQFYYLRSKAIVPPSSRNELFLENLQSLTEELLYNLNPEALVFDVEGGSTSNFPIVFPSNDTLDLTPFLKERFEERYGKHSKLPADE